MTPSPASPSKAFNIHSKLRKLGLLDNRSPGKTNQHTFELYFPRPPYHGAQYQAARGKDGLYNFVGLVLGHGGATVQRIQKASGAKIEVRDSAGNLNGAHPSSHGDPTLHAWVSAASRQRLDKAVSLLLDVMQPINGRLRAITLQPGGSVVLEPLDCSAEGGEAGAPDGAATGPRSPPPPPPPPRAPPAANAWSSKRLLLKQRPDERQMSPTSSLQRNRGAAAVAESAGNSDNEEAEPQAEGEQPPEPGIGAEAGAPLTPEKLAHPPPPPPPPPRSPARAPLAAAALSPLLQQAAAPQPEPPQQQEMQQPQMATVWATGLHQAHVEEPPSTPSGTAEPALSSATSATSAVGNAAGGVQSWSLWDTAGSASSFYEELQAAACDPRYSPGGSTAIACGSMHLPLPPSAAAPLALAHVHQQQQHQHQQHQLNQHQQQQYHLPLHSGLAVDAPFPGLAPQGLGLAYRHTGVAFTALTQQSLSSFSAEEEMQQLLAAVASMATRDG